MTRNFAWLLLLVFAIGCEHQAAPGLTFCCDENNDLYRALSHGSARPVRFSDPETAVQRAKPGSGVLVLGERTKISSEVLQESRAKKLRLLVECPESFPGLTLSEPRTAQWERVVVSSNELGAELPPMTILAAHGFQFRPVSGGQDALLTIARVAGFDTAVYGLPAERFPLLLRTPGGDLVATARMSNFVTARYAPTQRWVTLWEQILAQLSNHPAAKLVVKPRAHPAYARAASLPKNAEASALAAFTKWLDQSGLLISPAEKPRINELLKTTTQTIEARAAGAPNGDGSLGVMEGFASQIQPDGSQLRTPSLRADCNAEMAMVMAMQAANSGDARSKAVAKNLLDFVYFNSGMCKGARGDPKHPAFGLIAWGDISPAWSVANYGDDNARVLLATILAAKCLDSHAYDEFILKGLLANLRTTGKFGFRGDRIDIPALEQLGWRHFHDAETINYALNFEAYLWACYLWAYRETGEQEFLDKARTAISMTMKAYPNQWRWADNMERARILLPLAWLMRVDDKREHRQWLTQIANDLLANQQECGATPEHLGGAGVGGGHYVVPASNEAYGTTETPLIQTNADQVSDQLYTTGFALIGLHEAYATTGDTRLKQAADKLADYLVRIQVRSEKLPWLDGAWYRAFDFGKWDYWASSADVGWGAWSVEAGWCPAWIAATFGLRSAHTSIWDLTKDSRIKEHMPKVKPLMEQ